MRNIIRWVLVGVAIIIAVVALFFPEFPTRVNNPVNNPVIPDPKKEDPEESVMDVPHTEM